MKQQRSYTAGQWMVLVQLVDPDNGLHVLVKRELKDKSQVFYLSNWVEMVKTGGRLR